MTLINALGKPCPIPVIEAQKAMAALPAEGGQILVQVDNEIACQNIEKMAKGSGATCAYLKKDGDLYEVTITVGAGTQAAAISKAKPTTDFVVAVGTNQMGNGSEELGKILLKGFLYSLGELEEIPSCILFYNSGAHLTSADSTSVADLRAIMAKGTAIYTCGTCVDYYGIKDKLAVGEITNMYGIASAMAKAKRLVSL